MRVASSNCAAAVAFVALAGCAQTVHLPWQLDEKAESGASAGTPFVVDSITLPDGPGRLGADLDGDGRVDNQLGNLLAALAAADDNPGDLSMMLADGRLAPRLIVTGGGSSLGWQGASGEPPSDAVVGGLLDGSFIPDPRATPIGSARAVVHLPIFRDSAPVALPVIGLGFTLVEDDMGYRGELHGAALTEEVRPELYAALAQMIAANPAEHRTLIAALDENHDGVVTPDEIAASDFIARFDPRDVKLLDASGRWAPDPKSPTHDAMSLGFAFHARPACSAGDCPSTR